MSGRPNAASDPMIERALVTEGNAALRVGALVLLALAVVNALILPVFIFFAGVHFLMLPWLFTLLCAGICTAVWALARRGRVQGAWAWVVMLPFASLPTFFFLMTHVAMPAGAATFITGPISYLYFVVVALTGFLFNVRLSLVAGTLAVAGWLVVAVLARPGLQTLTGTDEILVGDIVDPQGWVLRAIMLFFATLVVAALAVVARRLVRRAVNEAEEKAWVRRLFGAYVSEEVAQRLVDEGERDGDRREVVVLFSDIRGFTSYSEQADPAEVVARLNVYFDAMVGAITEHGGVVDKFIGDAIMAVFGGLVPLDDPSAAAVRAAGEMRRRLEDLNRRWASEGVAPFETGIGLHRGEVLQGSIGSADRKDFTVIGDAVNTASRLEGLTKELDCAVVMSDAVYESLPEELREACRSLGEAPVKGRQAGVSVFGLSSVRAIVAGLALLLAAPSLALSVPESAKTRDAFDDGVHRVENLLLLDHETVAAGSTLRAGVLFRISEGWHIYWRNAGEGGMSTEVIFDAGDPLPGPVQWPAPRVYSEGGGQIITFGYGDEVLLFSEIEVPAGAEGELEIQAAVDYLVCEVECIPGQAQLSRKVRVAADAVPAPAEVLAIFEENAKRLPRTAAERGFDIAARYSHTPIAAPDRFDVRVDVDPCPGARDDPACPTLASPPELAVAALVFDAVPHVDLRVQEASGDGSGWHIALSGRASPDAPEEDARLSGIVLLRDDEGAFLPTAFAVPLPRFEAEPTLELGAAVATTTADPVSAGGTSLGLWQVLLLAFAGGMLLNLMPCVFPVLAIKAFAFVNLVHEKRQSIYLHSAAYTGGIVGSLVLLAVVVVSLQSAGTHVGWGFQFQEPRFIAVVSAVLVVFAANLFGVFEVGLPGGRMEAVTAAPPGARRSFGEGVLAVVLATPCSAPFLGTAVGFALSSHPAMIFAVFATLGLGLAAPFVVLTLVPGLTRFLPKPGAWMLVFKQFLGFALLGTTIWLLWLIGQMTGTDGMVRLLAFLLLVSLAVWAYGATQARGGRLKWAVGLVAAAGVVTGGVLMLDLSPTERVRDGGNGAIAWIDYEDAAVTRALAAGRPVFVDFTADWCITCQVNKARVLETPAVVAAVEEMSVEMMVADWTHRDDVIRAKLAEFGKAGVPMYLLYSPHAPDSPEVLPELLTRNLVIEAMRRASTDG